MQKSKVNYIGIKIVQGFFNALKQVFIFIMPFKTYIMFLRCSLDIYERIVAVNIKKMSCFTTFNIVLYVDT